MKDKNSRKHILIVDDDPDNRLFLRTVLESRGYECYEAKDGEFALGALRNSRFDLLLTDYQMPNMNGLSLIRNLQEDPDIEPLPAIMISGSVDYDLCHQAQAEGAYAFLQKPYSFEEMLSVVNEAMRTHKCSCC